MRFKTFKKLIDYHKAFKDNLDKLSDAGINLVESDIFDSYFGTFSEIKSIIYCDPPYRSTKSYESDFDHDKFWDWVRKKVRIILYMFQNMTHLMISSVYGKKTRRIH